MKIVGMDTKVASIRGDIITFEEHCQRLATFIEEIKGKALLLTQCNPELTEYIRSLKLVYLEELYIEDTTCFYLVSVQSPNSKDMPVRPDKIGKWADSVGIDENGYPKLYFDFWVIINRFRERLLADIIMPEIVSDMDFLVLFLKEVLLKNTLKWKYLSEERRGKCYELLFQYNVPDRFWLAITNNVRVVIGEFKDIENTLVNSKERYMNNSLLLVDIDRQPLKDQEVYFGLLKEIPEKRIYVWSYGTFFSLFDLKFGTFVKIIDAVLKIGVDNTYKLGELFSASLDDQDTLISDLRKMPTGDGKAYEELVEKILEFLFNDEFKPFKVKKQVVTLNKKRIRDFIIDNRNPRVEFWRDLKTIRGVEKILFDAKNYKDPVEYTKTTSTLRYLKNKAFGNFIIIISRHGVKDYEETVEDYSDDGQVILYLNDEDLIAMINMKREGKSPTFLIEEKYYDFLDKK